MNDLINTCIGCKIVSDDLITKEITICCDCEESYERGDIMPKLLKEVESDIKVIKEHLSNVSFGDVTVSSITDLEAIIFATRLIALQIKRSVETGDTL